jgi:hypothetical protein
MERVTLFLARIAPVALLAGCTTSQPSGAKKLLGVIPVPFTGSPPEPSWHDGITTDLLAPLAWCAVGMIIAGSIMLFFSKTKTGAGIGYICMGLVLTLVAAVMDAAIVFVAIISTICLVAGIIYIAYCFVTGRKINLRIPEGD